MFVQKLFWPDCKYDTYGYFADSTNIISVKLIKIKNRHYKYKDKLATKT